jgi:outer membrane protein OmpA-like peptidoglycan-associated protein
MKSFPIALCFVALMNLAGCAGRGSLVVLLPDSDGRVGTISVETSQGAIVVDRPYYAVAASPDKLPGTPRLMDKQDVEAKFDRAMAMEPAQPFRIEKYTFYYRFNSTELTADSKNEIAANIGQVVVKRPVECYVVGHADRVGSEHYNKNLSHRRALSVQQKLVETGINSKIILISFLGESKPQIDTPDEVEDPKNRRVELVVKYYKTE